jgi:two-component system CheB/CheR fusion protein
LTFDWREVDGPAARQPAAPGFGSTLIETAIPGAEVKREFPPDDFVCTIEVPLAEAREPGSATEG